MRKRTHEFLATMQIPQEQDVLDLIEDYRRDFGPTLPYEDAERLLVLYEELCELFERNLPADERGHRDILGEYHALRGN